MIVALIDNFIFFVDDALLGWFLVLKHSGQVAYSPFQKATLTLI
jgi:hypothetical protein